MYRHTQRGTLIRSTFGAGLLGVLLVALLAQEPLVAILGGAVLIGAGALFHSLTVTVDGAAVEARFGVGLIRFRVPLDRIEEVVPVRNVCWYGWGIRLTPHGWLYNVSGFDAVELRLRSGKRIRIGTDEPRRLAQAIAHARSGA